MYLYRFYILFLQYLHNYSRNWNITCQSNVANNPTRERNNRNEITNDTNSEQYPDKISFEALETGEIFVRLAVS